MLRPHLRFQLLVQTGRRIAPGYRRRRQQGSIALLLLAALAITVGSLAIANSSSRSLLRSAFQGESRQARAAALEGTEVIINELNQRRNRRLLVTSISASNWSNDPNSPNYDASRNTLCVGLRDDGVPGAQATDGPTDEALRLTRNSIAAQIPDPDDREAGFINLDANGTRQFRLIPTRDRNSDGKPDDIVKLSGKDGDPLPTRDDPAAEGYISINFKETYDTDEDGVIQEDEREDAAERENRVGYIRLTTEGRVRRNGIEVSRAQVTREFEVVPKCCGQSFGLPPDPDNRALGLHGNDVRPCNSFDSPNDALGIVVLGGNFNDDGATGTLRYDADGDEAIEAGESIDAIVCASTTPCTGDTAARTDDLVDPKVTGPIPIDLGDVPRFPYDTNNTSLDNKADAVTIGTTQQEGRIFALRVESSAVQQCSLTQQEVNDMNLAGISAYAKCNTVAGAWTDASYCRESEGEYHCLIERLVIGGNDTFQIDTLNGKINLYFVSPDAQQKPALDAGGSGILLHTRGDVPPASCAEDGYAYLRDLSFYGIPQDPSPDVQRFSLNGGGAMTALFIWAPYTTVSFNGVGGSPDFCGKIWAKNISLSGTVNLEVPPSAGDDPGDEDDTTNLFYDWIARSVSGVRLFWDRQ